MTTRHLAALLLSLATLSHAACGDDDDDDSPVISSGLPAEQKLSTLDDEDAQTACRNLARSFDSVVPEGDLKRATCTLSGIIAGIPDAAGGHEDAAISVCQETAMDCQEDKVDGGAGGDIDIGVPDEEDCDDAKVDPDFSDCEATVAEYERCMNGSATELKGQLSAVQCEMLSDLGSFSDFEISIKIEMIEECEAIREKCPGLDPFDDD